MEVDQEREQAERNLRETLRFVDAGTCRRTQLLAHFGQEHSGECGRCDVCTGEIATTDATEDAQKVMSAIYRTGERFGAHYVADLLIGADDERMRRFGHHELPTFGVGSDKPKSWWLSIAKDMEAAGLLVRRDGERSGLKISAAGKEVLYGRRSFEAVERPEHSASPGHGAAAAGTRSERAGGAREPAGTGAVWREDQERLFQCLRGLRKELAAEKGVPPYMIFSDKSLKAMVKNRPESVSAFLRVHGVGERKAELYGEAFLSRIRSFLATGECPEA
jgi:ATP-dependent DNA helicase RecQ